MTGAKGAQYSHMNSYTSTDTHTHTNTQSSHSAVVLPKVTAKPETDTSGLPHRDLCSQVDTSMYKAHAHISQKLFGDSCKTPLIIHWAAASNKKLAAASNKKQVKSSYHSVIHNP